MPFGDGFIRTVFLAQLEGIETIGHPLNTFYTQMATTAPENKTTQYCVTQFLGLNLPQTGESNLPNVTDNDNDSNISH